MKLLREIYHDHDMPREKYRLRKAARTILFNDKGEMALLNVSSYGYYKLCGGGFEDGEDVITALAREVKEKVGVEKISILGELGFIIECGNELELLQFNYCFISKVAGKIEKPDFTEDEKACGFCVEWHTVDKSIELLETCNPSVKIGNGIVMRDLTFLKEYKKTQAEYFLSRSASQVYLMRKHNNKTQILFGMRCGKTGNGEWDVAAGHCEKNETFTMTAHRETLEEFGVEFDEKDIVFTTIIHLIDYKGKSHNGYQYINAHFFVKKFKGTPRVCEYDKCSELKWFDIDNLPKNIFGDRQQAIENFIKKIPFSEIKS